MGDFEKQFHAIACRKKKIACSTNVIEKKYSCTAVRKKKCCKAISSFRGALQIPTKLQPFSSLAPFELWIIFGDAAELIIASYVQRIISLSQAVMEVNFSIKKSSYNTQRKLTF